MVPGLDGLAVLKSLRASKNTTPALFLTAGTFLLPARELGPKNIHVAHVVIDGAIDTAWIHENFPGAAELKKVDGLLDPDAIAENYWTLHTQPRTAWTHELDLRPYMERF